MPRTGFATGYDMSFFSEALLCNRDSVTARAAFGPATTRILARPAHRSTSAIAPTVRHDGRMTGRET